MKTFTLIILLMGITTYSAFSQDQNRKQSFNLQDGVALQGYDPVAYFKLGKAVMGDKQNGVVNYGGVNYWFSNVENKNIFKHSPAEYEPQYGGWCAYAMGKYGSKVEVDPQTFKITHGKLYLFYNKFFNNTLKLWNKDEENLGRTADANWKKLLTLNKSNEHE